MTRPTPSARRLAIVATLASALAVLLPAGGPAIAHGPDPILSGGLFGQGQSLAFKWSSAGTPPSAMRTAIVAAAKDASTTDRAKAPTFAYSSGAASSVYYGTDVPCGTNGIACMRRYVPDSFRVWFRENGRRFDWGTLRWCELSGSPDGCYEIENVMLDELGHVDVLDHHDNLDSNSDYRDAVVQTYSRTKPNSGWNVHAFERCDVATLQQQYDVAGWTTLYSTCHDVPTALTLSANRSSVSSGTMVTFTATLRSDGTGRLSNNPVSSRTVVLQRRSGTSWADVGTMVQSSTAGSYTYGLAPTSSNSYRALFRHPSNEGLLTSGSSAVSVSVTTSCTSSPCPLSDPATASR